MAADISGRLCEKNSVDGGMDENGKDVDKTLSEMVLLANTLMKMHPPRSRCRCEWSLICKEFPRRCELELKARRN